MTAASFGQVVFTAVILKCSDSGAGRYRADANLPLTAMGLRSKGKLEVRMKLRGLVSSPLLVVALTAAPLGAEKLMLAHVAINPAQGMLLLAKDSGFFAKYGFTADVILIRGRRARCRRWSPVTSITSPRARPRLCARGLKAPTCSFWRRSATFRRSGWWSGGFAVNQDQGSQGQNDRCHPGWFRRRFIFARRSKRRY